MSHHQKFDDPTNRVVCAFENLTLAEQARHKLVESGFDSDDVYLLYGSQDAEELDTSAKWFADTDKIMKKFSQRLRDGQAVLSLPIEDGASRERAHQILLACQAKYTTHFGEWVTEVMQSDS